MERRLVRLQAAGRWPADVDVWHVGISASGAEVDASVLDPGELERAARYRQPVDRLRYVATRAALRELLGERLGIRPASLRLTTTRRGRPELADPHGGLSFNVSHAGEHALIAISPARTVGVDIERVDPELDWRQLVDLVCTADEQRLWMAGPAAPLQREYFFRCWTAKEALLKALGIGIAEGLHALAVNPAGDGMLQPVVAATQDQRFAGAADFACCWLADLAGYIGCVAFGRPVDRSVAPATTTTGVVRET